MGWLGKERHGTAGSSRGQQIRHKQSARAMMTLCRGRIIEHLPCPGQRSSFVTFVTFTLLRLRISSNLCASALPTLITIGNRLLRCQDLNVTSGMLKMRGVARYNPRGLSTARKCRMQGIVNPCSHNSPVARFADRRFTVRQPEHLATVQRLPPEVSQGQRQSRL